VSELLEALTKRAERDGISRSEAIREAVRSWTHAAQCSFTTRRWPTPVERLSCVWRVFLTLRGVGFATGGWLGEFHNHML